MSISAVGDLGQSLFLRRESSRLDSELQRLAGELSSGQKADITTELGGDFRELSAIERSLSSITAFETTIREVSLIASVSQSALQVINSNTSDLTTTILGLDPVIDQTSAALIGNEARESFDSVVVALNTQVSGRSLFSGRALDMAPLVDSETILTNITAGLATATTADEVLLAIDTYFAPGGDFETVDYQGSTESDPIQIGDYKSTSPLLKADDARITGALKGIAIAAVLNFGILDGNIREQEILIKNAGQSILNAEVDLVDARAELGLTERKLEAVSSSLAAEYFALSATKSEITSVDALQAASELRFAEEQLQSLFVITGRLSSLSLSAYL